MTKQTINANYVLEWSLLPSVRNVVIDHLTPEMFEKQWQKHFLLALKSLGRTTEIEYTVLQTEILKVSGKGEQDKQYHLAISTTYNNHRVREADLKLKSTDSATSEVRYYIHSIEEFIKVKLVSKAVLELSELEDSSKSKEKFIKLQEAASFSIVTESEFLDFSNIDTVEKTRDDDLPPDGVVYKSSLNLVNSNSTIGGYKYGDVIMVASRSGGGKTTMMCQEGVFLSMQKAKVIHACFGDMSDFDIYCKYLSCYRSFTSTPVSSYEIYKNPSKYLDVNAIQFFNNIKAKAFDSDSMTVYDILARLSALKKSYDFDVIVIDYDANLKAVKDSMYEEGGAQYKALKAFASSHKCIVVIGCQVKPEWWDKEIIPMQGANESSKKQMNVDYMITLGWNSEYRYVGSANLAKIRRGVEGPASRVYLDGANSRIVEIDATTYQNKISKYKDSLSMSEDIMNRATKKESEGLNF